MNLFCLDVCPKSAGHLGGCPGKSCCTKVTAGCHFPCCRKFYRCLYQELFGIGIPYLDSWPIFCLGVFREIARGKCSTPESISAGRRPIKNETVAGFFDSCCKICFGVDCADTDNIYKGVATVTFVKCQLAPDHRDADAVAIVADALYHMFKEVTVFLTLQIAEVEGIHQRNRAGAHGDNIPNNPPYASCCPVKWINVAGVVMAFHAYCKGYILRKANNSRIVTGTQQYILSGGGKGFEEFFCRAVTAVFTPEIFKTGNLQRGKRTIQQ